MGWVAWEYFRLYQDGVNIGSTLEMLTEMGTRPIMAQRYIPEIVEGDKHILLVNGEPDSVLLGAYSTKRRSPWELGRGWVGSSTSFD